MIISRALAQTLLSPGITTRALWLLLLGILPTAALAAEGPVRSQYTEAELVSEVQTLRPGETTWLALRLKMDPTWHTYWVNPGEAGLKTELVWQDLPEGFKPGDIHWPPPKRYLQAGIMNYVYEDEVFLIFPLEVPATAKVGETVTLKVRADWLECDPTMCVPGGADLTLALVVENDTPTKSRWHEAFEKTRQSWPEPLSETWSLTAELLKDGYLLSMRPAGDKAATLSEAYFYSSTAQVSPSAKQNLQATPQGYVLALEKDTFYTGDNSRLQGVLQTDKSWLKQRLEPNLSVDIPIDSSRRHLTLAQVTEAGNQTAVEPGSSVSTSPALTFFSVLLLALAGGLILNLMPCVFPVLGLKIMGFVKQAGEDRAKIVAHGLIFTAGVLISFWILAGVLIALRAGGQELGWGFQLQEPAFVLALTLVLLLFGLNMSGVFEVGTSAVGVGHQLTGKSGLTGTFFSGVLATVVATPCAAPFLAPALGAALALPPGRSLAVFTAIALGLALPYLLLSAFPALLKRMPRPGAWMESFKQFMAFLLYGTVAYLIWILAGQVSADLLLTLLFALVLVAMGAWIYGRWGMPHIKPGTRWAARVLALCLIVLPTAHAWRAIQKAEARQVLLAQIEAGEAEADFLVWEPWSPEREAELRADNRFVYIDFTARWCATCQVNKRAYDNPEVVRVMLENQVALLLADWTNKDPAITRALAAFGRSAVPFNLLYAPDAEQPIIMPELFTAGVVLDKLKEAGARF